jgi:hypothetical protein
MSTYLRKCIDIAPTSIVTPNPFLPNDYRNLRFQSWWPALRATTSHLRLWADWPSLQHSPQAPGSDPRDVASIEALDAQLDQAHADGMQIILLPYRYPSWANETAAITVPDAQFEPWDRHARLSEYLAYLAGNRPNQTWKSVLYRMPPEGFGPDSRWARFVAWLWDRYGDRIAAIEVVNEPNLQLWPQRSPVETDDFAARWAVADTRLVVAEQVAQMMETVDSLSRARGDRWVLLAPSCSDTENATIRRYQTVAHPNSAVAETFTGALLTALADRGFTADERWVWAYHNYTDIERDRRHVVDVRALLAAGGWSGRTLDGGPELWATEGGVRLNVMNTRFTDALQHVLSVEERKLYQARVLTEALSRHHSAKGAGAGVGLLTQYTTYADRGFDDGILDEVVLGAAQRPSLAAWSAVPEYVAAPVQRAAWRPQP